MSSKNPSSKTLCYILTDRSGELYWAGGGVMAWVSALSLHKLPSWASKPEAALAAGALRNSLRLDLVPAPLRLP